MRKLAISFIVAAIASMALISSSAWADVIIASDDFESYSAGAQLESGANGTTETDAPGTGLNGGTGFSGAYNVDDRYKTQVTVVGSGLNYAAGSVMVDGGDRALRIVDSGDSNNLVVRPFSSQTGAVYISFLLRATAASVADGNSDENFFQFGFSNVATGEPKASVGIAGKEQSQLPMYFFNRLPGGTTGNTFGPAGSEIAFAGDQTYMVVAKLWKDGTSYYNKMDLFLDPTSDIEPGTPSLARFAGSDTSLGSVSNFMIRRFRADGGDDFRVDELRIGDSFASVVPVPEPSSVVLLAIGAVGGLAYRWRRRRSAG